MAKDELQELPGVGPSIAGDLRSLGVRRLSPVGRTEARLSDES